MRPVQVQKYVVSELDTGERVISERVPSVRSVAIGFWIGAGSRDETEAKAGVSHFIEHMLFKGSQRYTAQEIAEIFDGADGVAVTYDWRVETTESWMNALAPVARPVFAWNHHAIMRWGGEGAARRLGCRLVAAS